MRFDEVYKEILGEGVNTHGINIGDRMDAGEGVIYHIVRGSNVDNIHGSVMRVDVCNTSEEVWDDMSKEEADNLTPEAYARACAEIAQEGWSIYYDKYGNEIEDISGAISKSEQNKTDRDAYRGSELEDLIDL